MNKILTCRVKNSFFFLRGKNMYVNNTQELPFGFYLFTFKKHNQCLKIMMVSGQFAYNNHHLAPQKMLTEKATHCPVSKLQVSLSNLV